MAHEQLRGEQLVARTFDRLCRIQHTNAHRLELARDRAAVEGHAGADSGNHRINALEHIAAPVMHFRVLRIQPHVALLDVEKFHAMAPLFARLHQATVAVELWIGGQ